MAERPSPDWRNPVHLLAFGLGAGAARHAPGTVGTLAAVPLYLLLAPLPSAVYLALVALLFFIGIPLCGRTARDLGVHDHPGIVWDEVVGLLATLAFAPAGAGPLVAGFAVFRLFDIVKPWPIRWADRRVGGGLGIMLDDLLAAGYAAIVIELLRRFGAFG